MNTKSLILVVDDDVTIGNMVQEALEAAGYEVIRSYSGTEALMVLENKQPDLILLDLMLPGISGEELLPKIRSVPVIVMSAKADIDHKVRLLYDGASDYISKPFVISEMLARISATLRLAAAKPSRSQGATPGDNTVSACGVTLDPELMLAKAGGKEVSLTRTETAILRVLMINSEMPLSRNTILDRILDSTPDCTDRSLKQHISNVRKKLEGLDGTDHIEAVYGIGFRFH